MEAGLSGIREGGWGVDLDPGQPVLASRLVGGNRAVSMKGFPVRLRTMALSTDVN